MTANIFDYGDQIKVSANTFKNASDVATDPTTVTFKYKKPDGTMTTLVYLTDAAVVRTGAGAYYVLLTLNMKGTWYVRWEGTGAVIAADEDNFRVVSNF